MIPVRFPLLVLVLALASIPSALRAAAPLQSSDGEIVFPVDAAKISGTAKPIPIPKTGEQVVELNSGGTLEWAYKPTRWGRYDLVMTYAVSQQQPGIQIRVLDTDYTQKPAGTGGLDRYSSVTMGRLYLPTSDPFSIRLACSEATAGVPIRVARLVLRPAPEGHPEAQSGTGRIELPAHSATTHSVMMRYEPATNKNCLGYWVNPSDWADWTFEVEQPGTFDVQVWQGCGRTQGGSEALVEVGRQQLPFIVEETGHFQYFVPRQIGRVTLDKPGSHTLAIKPRTKKAGAIMDIQRIVLTPAPTSASPTPGARDFIPARRIVVLGDSITYAGGWLTLVETWLHLQFPESKVQFFNLGLPSETVSGLSEPGHAGGSFPRPTLLERLDRVLEQAKPDLIVACYGMNDGIYHPFSDERFQKFQNGIRELREKAGKAGVRVIHLTPPVFDPLPLAGHTLPAGKDEYRSPFEGYNTVLDRYADWLVAQRVFGWEVIDIHGPMNRFLAERRKTDPKFLLAGDGVHANDQGHWIIAREVLRQLGADPTLLESDTPDRLIASSPRGKAVLDQVTRRQTVMKDPLLTAVGHKRPGMGAGKPLAEAEAEAARIGAQLNPPD